MPLLKCVPDTNPALGGLQVLSHVNRENLAKQYKMKDNMDLVKHIVNLHDGEVRQVGEERWEEFPASGRMLTKAQLVRNAKLLEKETNRRGLSEHRPPLRGRQRRKCSGPLAGYPLIA